MKTAGVKPLFLSRPESGFISVDFLFGFILVMGLSSILLAFAFTLSVVEGMQYIAFASARAAFASNADASAQQALGEAKYTQLLKTPGLSNIMKKQWFVLNHSYGDHSSDYAPNPDYKNKFYGMIIDIQVSYLDFIIPLYGSTTGGNGNGFPARITGFLGRESSADECSQFMGARWGWIKGLDGTYGGASGGPQPAPGDDNGC